jgi:Lysozyme like domain
MTMKHASEYPPIPLTPRILRRSEVIMLAAMYWPLGEVDNAAEVAWLESGFQTAAWNRNGEDSRGLWQINTVSAAHPQLAAFNLWDPQVNAYHAAQIWRSSGWRAWYNSALRLGLIAER